MTEPLEPPGYAISMALVAAKSSPCAKSKRGVAAYVWQDTEGNEHARPGRFLVACSNSPPYPLACKGDSACKAVCAQYAVHAEEAVVHAVSMGTDIRIGRISAGQIALVHVKVNTLGEHVPVSPKSKDATSAASCLTCSRTMLAFGIGGIWLYESPYISVELANVPEAGESVPARWRFYRTLDFHMETLENCDIPLHIKTVDLPEALRQLGGVDIAERLGARVDKEKP